MLSMIVLGIFIFLIIIFMVVLVMETLTSATDAEKRYKKKNSASEEKIKHKNRSPIHEDEYFNKYNRRI